MQFGNVYDRRREEEGYCTAQVCLAGHVATDSTEDFPHHMEKFCSSCGAQTITACPKCNTGIRGHLRGSGVSSRAPSAPSFCFECGAQFPWTEAALAAARELIDMEEGVTAADREALKNAVAEVATDTARSSVGATRLRRVWGRLAPALREVIVGVATEGAKRLILGK